MIVLDELIPSPVSSQPKGPDTSQAAVMPPRIERFMSREMWLRKKRFPFTWLRIMKGYYDYAPPVHHPSPDPE